MSCLVGSIASAQNWITGYYVDTAIYVSDIPWSKLTHTIHFKAYPGDATGVLAGIPGSNADTFTAAAHAGGNKALLCVADNNSNQSAFRSALTNNLTGFVNNIVTFVNAHNYDGVDLDWETGSYGGTDGTLYINLINALKSALGPNKIVTIAVYWNNGLERVVQSAASSISQVNVMCYDMDQWLNGTFYNEALYPVAGDSTHTSCSAEAAQFASYISPAKIGMGIAAYGRVWSGCSNTSCSDGLYTALQTWSGTPNQSTITYGNLVGSSYWSNPQSWDSTRGASYISINQSGAANDKFISFTGPQQINEIVKVGKNAGYGGYMLFTVDYDVVSSASGDARHPLASAAYSAVFGSGGGTTPPVNSAPVISGGLPTGTLSATTNQSTLQVTTNENATCKYSTTAGTAYSAMQYPFLTTGGTTHSSTITNLSPGASYNYYVRCADTSGLADSTDYVISFSVAPLSAALTVSITPNAGSGTSGTFVVQATDPNGSTSLQQLDLFVGTAVGATSSCYIEYNPTTKVLYLQSNDGSTWAQAALASGAALANSQCSINTATASATASGQNLNLSLPITFSGTFAGTRSLFTFAADSTGAMTGWQSGGSWTVPAPSSAGTIAVAVSPSSGAGRSQTFTLQASSSGGASAIRQAALVIGPQVGANKSCSIQYDPVTRMVSLRSSNNSSWLQGLAGSATALSNNMCSVDTASVVTSSLNNTLSVMLPVTFTKSLSGTKSLFGSATDATGTSTGWQTLGTYTVQ